MAVPSGHVVHKLAWIKGMEIQIDHPLVPMALLPVAPCRNIRARGHVLNKKNTMPRFTLWPITTPVAVIGRKLGEQNQTGNQPRRNSRVITRLNVRCT